MANGKKASWVAELGLAAALAAGNTGCAPNEQPKPAQPQPPAAVRTEAEVETTAVSDLPVHNNLLPAVKPGEFMAYYGDGNFALNDPAAVDIAAAIEKAKIVIASPENNTWPKEHLQAEIAKGKTYAAVVFMEKHIPDAGTNAAVDFEAIKAAVKAEVKAAKEQGFNGIFLSGIDEAIANTAAEPQRFAGIKQAMAELVVELRNENPDLAILQNRGLEIAKYTAPYVDALVAVNGFSDKGQPRPESEVKWVNAKAKEAMRAAERAGNELKLLAIEFPQEKSVNAVAATAVKEGFVPYIGPVDGNLVGFTEQPAYRSGPAK